MASVTRPAAGEFTAATAPTWAQAYRGSDYPAIGLAGDAVCFAPSEDGQALEVLTITRAAAPFQGLEAFPGGFIDWATDASTRETAIRELREETGTAAPVFFEELKLFDANGRDPRQWAGREENGAWVMVGARVVSHAFLALTSREARTAPMAADDAAAAHWCPITRYLPYEDTRDPLWVPRMRRLLDVLFTWANGAGESRLASGVPAARAARIHAAFGHLSMGQWNEELAADRVRLLEEAGLFEEGRRNAWGDVAAPREDLRAALAARARPRRLAGPDMPVPTLGAAMAFDHRLMLATALGRLRGKIKYVPATLAALTGPSPSMADVHAVAQGVAGRGMHRANFHRLLTDSLGLLTPAGPRPRGPGKGRPGPVPTAYRYVTGVESLRLDPSIRYPWTSPAR